MMWHSTPWSVDNDCGDPASVPNRSTRTRTRPVRDEPDLGSCASNVEMPRDARSSVGRIATVTESRRPRTTARRGMHPRYSPSGRSTLGSGRHEVTTVPPVRTRTMTGRRLSLERVRSGQSPRSSDPRDGRRGRRPPRRARAPPHTTDPRTRTGYEGDFPVERPVLVHSTHLPGTLRERFGDARSVVRAYGRGSGSPSDRLRIAPVFGHPESTRLEDDSRSPTDA
jgi:hypothetical protein